VLVRGNSYVLGVQRVAQTRLSCLVLGPKTTASRLDEPNYATTEGYLATQLDEAWMGVQCTRIRMSAGDRAAAVEAFTWRNGCIERSKPDGLRKANCARSNWDASSQGRLTALIHKAIPKNGAIESTQVSKVRPRLCFGRCVHSNQGGGSPLQPSASVEFPEGRGLAAELRHSPMKRLLSRSPGVFSLRREERPAKERLSAGWTRGVTCKRAGEHSITSSHSANAPIASLNHYGATPPEPISFVTIVAISVIPLTPSGLPGRWSTSGDSYS
jgi:hypothetical protein